MAVAGLEISTATASAVAVLAFLLYALGSAVYNYISSPVPRGIPGPWLAKFTTKWITFVDTSGYRSATLDKLHKRYGPVVQVAPNELSFSTIDAIKPIYGIGTTCIKSPAYDTFGRQGLFQMKDPEQHRQRLRGVAHIFTMGSLLQIEPTIQRTAAGLVKAVGRKLGKETDALLLMRLTALENSGSVLLGKEFGCFDEEGTVRIPDYVHYLDNTYIVFAVKSLSPLLFSFLKLLPIKGLQDFLSAPDVMYKYGFAAMSEYINKYGRESAHRSLLTKLLQGDRSNGLPPLPDAEIGVETSNLLFAATDTTSNTLAYTLYRLATRPEWQDRLRDEIRKSRVADEGPDGFSFKALQSLPVLNAIVQETLRVHPAAPSALPRITTGKGIDIAGLHVPANVIVSMQARTTQTDPAYFSPNAGDWDPSRWLKSGSSSVEINNGTPEQREMMLVWGKGSRACLGQHMAVMEIMVTVARLLAAYSLRIASDKTHDDMIMTDHFTLIPKGQRCGLTFEKAS